MNNIYQSRRANFLKYYEYLVYIFIAFILGAYIFGRRGCIPKNSSIEEITAYASGHTMVMQITFFTGLYLLISYFVKIPAPGFNKFIKLTFIGALVAFISMQIRCTIF